MDYILSIDQGTTSSRAIVFDAQMHPVASAQQDLPQHFPASGWVEHDPCDIWDTVLTTCRTAIGRAGIEARALAGIGLTNQRETTLIWDRATGTPIHKAIVWQDRRTADICGDLERAGNGPMVRERTGLLLDPYFSGTKVKWLLDTVPGARQRAEAGALAFGTVDSYLVWKLTGGRVHVTDATNAARTLLYNIRTAQWDAEICEMLGIPMALLPEVKDCAAAFGHTEADILGARVPILGIAGDQHAAAIGQACFAPGMLKATYGTGCFALLNTGERLVSSQNRLLGTIAYRLDGKTTYALEGSIFVAGAVVQWLRDGLQIIEAASDTAALAGQGAADSGVYLVPAFVGLGAPYWDAACRGAIYGLTRATDRAALARAALESVGYQTRDLWEAMRADLAGGDAPTGAGAASAILRVDGGMSASDWTMQFLADILGAPVDRPVMQETTALGAAWLAGMRAGLYPDARGFADAWALERRFEPTMPVPNRAALYAGWQDAVRRTLSSGGAGGAVEGP